MTGETTHRRRFLAGLAAGAAVVGAGCNGRPWDDDEAGATTFTRSEADSVLDEPAPAVDRPVPVEPTPKSIENERSRVDDLLAAVPDSLGPEDVPNGVVRASIADRRDSALEYRTETVDATGAERYHALRTARDAREAARASATTLAAIDADREELLSELADERRALRSTLESRLEEVAYRGEDDADGRLRGALFYADLEDDLETAERRVDRWDVDAASNVIDVGAGAGDLEFVTATTTVWNHCIDRYESVTDDRVDLESAFVDALDASVDRADGVDLPDQGEDDWLEALVDGEVEQGFDQTLLWDAVRPVYRGEDRLRDALEDGRLGPGLAAALRFEQEYRAFEVVRDRFEDGELTAPETIDTIRTQRTAAISAAESATEAVTRPSLGVARLADTVRSLEWTDEAIRRQADGDPEVNVTLGSEYSEYACLRARLEVLPGAVEAFRDRLLEG